MADLSSVQPGRMSREEGLAALEDLWGTPAPSHEQDKAESWARRALGQPPAPGDDRLLIEVDSEISERYARSVRRAS